mgnify:CR=1 FL=1
MYLFAYKLLAVLPFEPPVDGNPSAPSTISTDAKTGIETFFNSSLGQTLQAIAAVVAVLVVIWGLVNLVKLGARGSIAKGVGQLAGTVVAAAFLMNLRWAETLINIGGSAASKVLDLLTSLV